MPGLRPWATISGISGWSLGYQSAWPNGLLICASVKPEVLPGRCLTLSSGVARGAREALIPPAAPPERLPAARCVP